MTIYDDKRSAELLAAELQAELEESATDPTTAQPATPGEALRWAAERITARLAVADVNDHAAVALLGTWARDLDAAPAAPAAPAEPSCTCAGAAEAIRTRLAEAWPHLDDDPVFLDQVAHHAAAAVCIAFGPLSSVPPAGTEGDG